MSEVCPKCRNLTTKKSMQTYGKCATCHKASLKNNYVAPEPKVKFTKLKKLTDNISRGKLLL